MVAEALEVLVEMQDVDARALGGDSDGQVGKRKAVSAVRAFRRQLAHRRQYGSLHAGIHGNLTEAVQRSLDRGNSIGASRVYHQLVAHGPAPADITAPTAASSRSRALGSLRDRIQAEVSASTVPLPSQILTAIRPQAAR